MKTLSILFLALALAGCTPKEADDDDGKGTAPGASASGAPPPPAAKPGDWMWQKQTPSSGKKDNWALKGSDSLDAKGTPGKTNSPLGIGDDPLNQKAKK